MRTHKIAVGDLGEFFYGDYKEPFVQLEGAVPGYPQGALLTDGSGDLLCAFCGRIYQSLATHIKAHGLSAMDYKREVGLLQSSSLVNERIRADMAARALQRPRWEIERVRAARKSGAYKGASFKRTPEHLNKTGRCYAQVIQVGRSLMREHGRLTRAMLARKGIDDTTVRRYFSSWNGFCEVIGAPKASSRKRITDADLLLALRSLAEELGRTPSVSDMKRFGIPHATTYLHHFGSLAEAARLAGLDPNLPTPLTRDLEQRVLVAYATTGSAKRVAATMPIGHSRISEIFARYGAPFAYSTGRGAENSARRAWAADMARRLALVP